LIRWFNDDRRRDYLHRALRYWPVVPVHCLVDWPVQVAVYMIDLRPNARRRSADHHYHSVECSPAAVAAEFSVVPFVFSIHCLEYCHHD
jgi:hypothetical protein